MKTAFLMIISTICFAIVNAIVKYMDEFGPMQLVFFRSIASLFISFIQLKYIGISPWGNNKPVLALRGISGVIALFMFFVVLQNVSLGTAVTLQYLSPIFTAIIAVFMLKEKIPFFKWVILFLCFIGVGVLKLSDLDLNWFYLALGIGTAVLSGLAYNCVRKCRETDHPLVAVFYFPLFGVPIAGILCFSDWVNPHGWDWLLIVGLGVFTQIAQYTMTLALQSNKAANVTIFKYLGVIYAFLIGFFYFDESISPLTVVAAAIILFGIVAFNYKGFSKRSKRLNQA